MGKVYEVIDVRLRAFLDKQPIFFVATAPLDADGLINCSPKGNRDEFAVLDGHRVAYVDQTGSGIETVAHLQENGRIIVMFCAFEGPPRIVRLHGTGRAVLSSGDGFAELMAKFPKRPVLGVRSVVVVDVARISDSCGYAVPLMEFQGHRDILDPWMERKGQEGIEEYWVENNLTSLDGLPGLHTTHATS